ncbi:MAG: hypothetical protein AAF919_09275 [Pseudomonadota bacterium]
MAEDGITLPALAAATNLTMRELRVVRNLFFCPVRAMAATTEASGKRRLIFPLDPMIDWLRQTLPGFTTEMELKARRAAITFPRRKT